MKNITIKITIVFASLLIMGCDQLNTLGSPASLEASDEVIRVQGQSADTESFKKLTLFNNGDTTATNLEIISNSEKIAITRIENSSLENTCSKQLKPKKDCNLYLSLSSSETGVVDSSFRITYKDGKGISELTIDLWGMIEANPLAELKFLQTEVAFSSAEVGEVTEKVLTLVNFGGETALNILPTLSSGEFNFKGGAYPGTGGSCGLELASQGASCSIVIEFSSATIADYSSNLSLSYYNGDSVEGAEVFLSGSVVNVGGGPLLSVGLIENSEFNFDPLPIISSNEELIEITNVGETEIIDLQVGSLPSPFSNVLGSPLISDGGCGQTLQGGASCSIVIRFSPLISLLYSKTLTIQYYDGVDYRTAGVLIRGQGLGLGLF